MKDEDKTKRQLIDELRELRQQVAELKVSKSELKQAEEEVRLLQTMTMAISEARDFNSALGVALRKVCEATGWVFGEAWVPSSDGTVLEYSPERYSSVSGLEKFAELSERITFPPGRGLPGRAWTSKQSVWMHDVRLYMDFDFQRPEITMEADFKAGVAVPVFVGDEVVAVMVFFMFKPHEEDERLIGLVSAVAAQLGLLMQRKRAEGVLIESEERFRSVTQSATDAIISADSRGNIISWNKGAETIFGYSEEEVLGKPLTLLMPERYKGDHRKGLERVLSTGESDVIGKTVELHGLRNDGSEFPLEISLSTWKKGGEPYYCGIIRDVTERKRMEQELLRAEKLASLGVLSAGAAHEINNPLNVIAIQLHLFLKNKALGPPDRQACRTMLEEVERVHEIVEGLDTFARQMKAEREPVAIQEELSRVLQRMAENIQQPRIEVVEDFLPTSPVVMGDPSLLHQALGSILDNAVKAMPGRGSLTLQVREVARDGEPWVNILITDTGVGIRPEHLPKVFDPFFTTRKVGEGKGLGLSIALGIVEDHGGTISVESTEGLGTTFTIELPLERTRENSD
ncbi:MAG: PAS domain S-box protein [Nitrospinae bacterium]|nr:PAS domain S-box protein [Nitrospinota bacterium]